MHSHLGNLRVIKSAVSRVFSLVIFLTKKYSGGMAGLILGHTFLVFQHISTLLFAGLGQILGWGGGVGEDGSSLEYFVMSAAR